MPAADARLATVRWAERPGSPGRPTEDRLFTTSTAVVVLDGASQPDPAERDGGWLAGTLGHVLQEQLVRRTDSLKAILADSIAAVVQRYDLTPCAGPSTTVSIVRWGHETVDVLVLGDTPVVALTRDGDVRQVRDDRLRAVGRQERDKLRAGRAERCQDLRRSLVAVERAQRNRPGGYWIAEADPDAAGHAHTQCWDRRDLNAVLVVTDGVSAGPDRYGTPPDWPSAFTLAARSPQALVEAVHDVEEDDHDRRRWPRSKRHDDKTAVLIEFDGTA